MHPSSPHDRHRHPPPPPSSSMPDTSSALPSSSPSYPHGTSSSLSRVARMIATRPVPASFIKEYQLSSRQHKRGHNNDENESPATGGRGSLPESNLLNRPLTPEEEVLLQGRLEETIQREIRFFQQEGGERNLLIKNTLPLDPDEDLTQKREVYGHLMKQLTTTCGDSSRLKASLPSLTVNLQRLLFFSPDQGGSEQQEGEQGNSGSSNHPQRSPPPLQRPQAILNLLLYLSSLYRKQGERLASHIKQQRLASRETKDDVSSSSSSSSHLSRKAELRGGEERDLIPVDTYEENKTEQKKIDGGYSSINQRNSIESEERSDHTQASLASATPLTATTPTPRTSASKKGYSNIGAGGEGPDGARRRGGEGEQDTSVSTSSKHGTAANIDGGDTNSQNRTHASLTSHQQRVGGAGLSSGIVGLNPPAVSLAPPSATPPFTTPRSIRCESISSIHTDSTLVGGVYTHATSSSSRGRVSKHPHSSSSLLRKRDYARHQKEDEERRGLSVSSSGRPYHRLSKQQNGFEGGRRSKGGGRGRGGGGRTRGGEQEGEQHQEQGGPWVVEEDDEIDDEEEEEDEEGEEQENNPPLHELGLVYELSGISEVALLRDIVYTLQGIDGIHITYDATLQTYLLSPKIRASNSLRSLVSHLSGLGGLYRRLIEALETRPSSTTGFEKGGGSRMLTTKNEGGSSVISEAFRQSMQEQLQEYYKLIAAVEHDILRSAQGGDVWSHVTLRRFAVWLQQPYCRMRALAALAEESRGLKGGSLLSTIYAHSKRGDAELRQLMLHILKRAGQPLAEMIDMWIDEGELRDKAEEFFVAQRPLCSLDEFWTKRYYIDSTRIPSFLSLPLALEILRIGKSLNFLKKICGLNSSDAASSLDREYAPRKTTTTTTSHPHSKDLLLRDFSSFSLSSSFSQPSRAKRGSLEQYPSQKKKVNTPVFNKEDEKILSYLPPNMIQELNLHVEERRLRFNFLKGGGGETWSSSGSARSKVNKTPYHSNIVNSYGYILAQRDDKKTRRKSYYPYSLKDFFFLNDVHQGFLSSSSFSSSSSSSYLHCHDEELPWLEELQKRVQISSNIKNKLLVHSLLGQHQLLYYLEGIRKFILLEDSEFTRSLLEAAESHEEQQRQKYHSYLLGQEEDDEDRLAPSFDEWAGGGGIAAQPSILAAVDAAARNSTIGTSLSSLCPPLLHSLTVRFPPSSTTISKLPGTAPSSTGTSGGGLYDKEENMSYSDLLKDKLKAGKTGSGLLDPNCSSSSPSSSSCEMWNSFYLDFKLQPPISSVCTPEVMGVYHKIFYLQWKLHRAAYALSNAWLKGRSFYKFEQDYHQKKRRQATELQLQKQRDEIKKREQEKQPHTPRASSSSFQRATTPTTPSSAAGGGRPGSARRSSSTRFLRSNTNSRTSPIGASTPRSSSSSASSSSSYSSSMNGIGGEQGGGGYPSVLERMKQKEKYQKRVFVQQKILSLINEVSHVLSNLQIYLVEDLLNPTWRLMMQLTVEMCADFDDLLAVQRECLQTLYDGMFLYDAETLQNHLLSTRQQKGRGGEDSSNNSSSSLINPILMTLLQDLLNMSSQLVQIATDFFSNLDLLVDDENKDEESHHQSASASGLDAIATCLEQVESRIRGIVLEFLRQIDLKQASAYRGGGGGERTASGGGYFVAGCPGSVNKRRSIFSDRGEALRALRCRLDFNFFYDHEAHVFLSSASSIYPTSSTSFPSSSSYLPPSVLTPPASNSAVLSASPSRSSSSSSLSYPTLLRRRLQSSSSSFIINAPFMPGGGGSSLPSNFLSSALPKAGRGYAREEKMGAATTPGVISQHQQQTQGLLQLLLSHQQSKDFESLQIDKEDHQGEPSQQDRILLNSIPTTNRK
ncbi:spc97 spc98 family protein [Cystoisospora suis]|uniref:Spc97 spc98 family protein n=1 Tax=Cystoisospora suis TaxID=483139 RepID=A0A2C6KZQ5_9APIC|nr:spc97 spc98 family protein [Cystoisospora suis]